MDTRAEPLCVCAHRSYFSDARSRVYQSRSSTFKKANVVVSSGKETNLHQNIPCGTDNVQDTVLHIAGSIVGGSISTISPNADRSLPAVIPSEVFILPERSRSCNGRVETSATVTRYIQASGARRIRGANISSTNDLRERDVNGHSSDLKSHKIPNLPHSGPDDSKSMKKDDYKPSHKTQDVKIYMAHDQSTQTEPIQTLLGLPPRFTLIDEPCVSTSSSPTLIETKGIQKEEEEAFWAPHSKRRKQGTEDVKPMFHARYVVGDADGSSHRVFDARDWPISKFFFTDPQYQPPSNDAGIDASRSKDRSNEQVDLRPGLKRFPASAPNSLGKSEDLGHLDMTASSFVSALDKFNEIVTSCNAMERFDKEPNRCLGNRKDGVKCRTLIKSKNQQAILQLLTDLAAMNIKSSTPKCVIDELGKLTELAVCHYQCKNLQEEVNRLILPDPPMDSAHPSADPILEKDTKIKSEEVPSPPGMSDESTIFGGQVGQVVDTPSFTSADKITYWCRGSPKWALVYSPEYRPYYQPASSSEINVEDWVMKQAATPLTRSELKEGYLYVYWNQATFGVCKIGYTCKDVGTRLRKWESLCKHIAEEQYRSVKVRNVKRLERLVHAELKDYRVKEHGCHGCLGNHKEWFRGVGLDIIHESIAFWTQWMEKGQYEEIKGEWRLKMGARKELQQLCTKLAVINARESKEKSTTKVRRDITFGLVRQRGRRPIEVADASREEFKDVTVYLE